MIKDKVEEKILEFLEFFDIKNIKLGFKSGDIDLSSDLKRWPYLTNIIIFNELTPLWLSNKIKDNIKKDNDKLAVHYINKDNEDNVLLHDLEKIDICLLERSNNTPLFIEPWLELHGICVLVMGVAGLSNKDEALFTINSKKFNYQSAMRHQYKSFTRDDISCREVRELIDSISRQDKTYIPVNHKQNDILFDVQYDERLNNSKNID